MKIFNFALLGLLNAQAPTPQKDCTDCLVSLSRSGLDARISSIRPVVSVFDSTSNCSNLKLLTAKISTGNFYCRIFISEFR